MVAAGIPKSCPDHAFILTQMALEVRDYFAQYQFRDKRLAFRIGINSGSVVAGEIGQVKKGKGEMEVWQVKGTIGRT